MKAEDIVKLIFVGLFLSMMIIYLLSRPPIPQAPPEPPKPPVIKYYKITDKTLIVSRVPQVIFINEIPITIYQTRHTYNLYLNDTSKISVYESFYDSVKVGDTIRSVTTDGWFGSTKWEKVWS